ncbi:unnamed protein product [Amoebophrya sp. A25]|nr:unnamed protein product [Amoebophrya sp. A25]|eukprot:GSA25T00017416001.1
MLPLRAPALIQRSCRATPRPSSSAPLTRGQARTVASVSADDSKISNVAAVASVTGSEHVDLQQSSGLAVEDRNNSAATTSSSARNYTAGTDLKKSLNGRFVSERLRNLCGEDGDFYQKMGITCFNPLLKLQEKGTQVQDQDLQETTQMSKDHADHDWREEREARQAALLQDFASYAIHGRFKKYPDDFCVREVSSSREAEGGQMRGRKVYGETASGGPPNMVVPDDPRDMKNWFGWLKEMQYEDTPTEYLKKKEVVREAADRAKIQRRDDHIFQQKYATSAEPTSTQTPNEDLKVNWAPRHLWFVVAKRNRTTEEAKNMIARYLRVPAERICYGGLKDRRALTVQHMSLRVCRDYSARYLEKKLLWFGKGRKRQDDKADTTHIENLKPEEEPADYTTVRSPPRRKKDSQSSLDSFIAISNVEGRMKHCALGAQHGNHFTIGLRNARLVNLEETDSISNEHQNEIEDHTRTSTPTSSTSSSSFGSTSQEDQGLGQEGSPSRRNPQHLPVFQVARARAFQVAKHGFINYFGPQRFGTGSILSSDIGKACILGDYAKACSLIMHAMVKPDNARAQEAAHAFDRGDYDTALANTQPSRLAERNLLRVLLEQERDSSASGTSTPDTRFERALREGVPKSMRLFYARAYVSELWNHAASARCRDHVSGATPFGDNLADLVLVDKDLGIKNRINKIRTRRGAEGESVEEQHGGRGFVGGGHQEDDVRGCDEIEITLPRVRQFMTFEGGSDMGDTLADIVVPLLGRPPQPRGDSNEGHMIPEQPGNHVLKNTSDYWHEVYKTLLGGKDPGELTANALHREFEVEGGYRRLFAYPTDVRVTRGSEEVIRVPQEFKEGDADQDAQPVQPRRSDRLLFTVPEFHGPGEALELQNNDGEDSSTNIKTRPGRSLVFSFTLKPGEYASVCLREMLQEKDLEFVR